MPGGRVQFLDRPAGANGNGDAPANGDDAPAATNGTAGSDTGQPIPF